jgi:TonB family protein
VKLLFVFALLTVWAATGLQAQETIPPSPHEAENFDTLAKFYPARAIAAKQEGLVGFLIRLDRDAHPTACEVTFSSGHRALDQETCGLVLTHAVFQPTLDKDGKRVAAVREGVINWKLPTTPRSVVPAVSAAVTAANSPDKLICKRRQKSESFASYERICMTKREWQMERDQSREAYAAEQGSKGWSNGITIGGSPGN